ncbi:hypothetical protein V6N12_016197 [Hibiscus sabdariffa]|uniref:Uncharacterized protein n=1 Tax=Hibiscus sabdariffa TaxID=183260 RepID=A0ABR2CAX3_9ROSI
MSGSHGSRPLEAVVVPVELTSLRHHGSLVPFEAQPVTKKGLCNIDDTKVIMEDGQQPNEYFDTLMGDIDENVLSANGGSVVGKMLNDSNQVIQDGNGAKQTQDKNGRVLSASIRGGGKVLVKNAIALKGGQRQGLKTKKEDRSHTKPVLAACISALVSELDKGKAVKIERNRSEQRQGDNIQ